MRKAAHGLLQEIYRCQLREASWILHVLRRFDRQKALAINGAIWAGIRLTSGNLLQGCGAQLDGDVSEETVSLCAEIPDHVRVGVRRSEELHFAFRDLDTLWQDSLHCYVAALKAAPEVMKRVKTGPITNCANVT